MKLGRVFQGVAILIAMLVALGIASVSTGYHRELAVRLIATTMPIPDLGDQLEESGNAYWFDDYYTVFPIDDDTYAIGETRYHQLNFNYLLLGTSRAILLDSGPGVRDITPVVRSLTSLPVTSVVSHLHYDHTGNFNRLDGGAMIDLPFLRERESGGLLLLEEMEHLGFVEGFAVPSLKITEWWSPGEDVDLGGRRVVVHHTPGHTKSSIILEDPEHAQFFTGDMYYPGELFAFLTGSSLGDYTRSTEAMVARMDEAATLYGAHRMAPSGLPTLERADLVDLVTVLHSVRDGSDTAPDEEGVFPRSIEVNKNMTMLMDVPAGRQWH
jgi:glyoxylase-like metal-dependent hydrolase (beta-lactamase superfamily II)